MPTSAKRTGRSRAASWLLIPVHVLVAGVLALDLATHTSWPPTPTDLWVAPVAAWLFVGATGGPLARWHAHQPLRSFAVAWGLAAVGLSLWFAAAGSWLTALPVAAAFVLVGWRWLARWWALVTQQPVTPARRRGSRRPPAHAGPAALAAWMGRSLPAGIPLGLDDTGAWVAAGEEGNVCLVGPPGAGKTRRHVAPAVLRHPGPVIATSTKPDVAGYTAAWRAAHGQCWWWDPSDSLPVPEHCQAVAWSPLVGLDTYDDAINAAAVLVAAHNLTTPAHTARHFQGQAEQLLAPLLYAAALGGHPMSTVHDWIVAGADAWDTPQGILDAAGAGLAAGELRAMATGARGDGARETHSVVTTTRNLLAAYRRERVRHHADQAGFDPLQFAAGEGADTLFIVVPDDSHAQLGPVVAALLDQLIAARKASATSARSGDLLLALDEVANIAPLPRLASYLTETRSYGVRLLAGLQAWSQWGQWDERSAATLRSAWHQLVLYPGVADQALLRDIAALGGRHLVDRHSHTHQQPDTPRLLAGEQRGQASRSTTVSAQWEDRLGVDDVTGGLATGEVRLTNGLTPGPVLTAPDIDHHPWHRITHAAITHAAKEATDEAEPAS